MGLKQSSMYLILFFLLAGFASSFTHISNGAFESHGTTGRNLLQAKKACSEDFEHKNYTILTSKCKGPLYPTKGCCDALKEFACPFADKLNDLTTDCASTMFSYINLYGKYPPGLFANMCREGKEGLECPEQTASGLTITKPSLLILTSGFLVLLFQLF
ncbi:GPI-anchored protein LLG2-like [Durio zibethinus]|uniref:GPI-anchored protein LLG2-like n=1 Tax=Durio zibethinus TaxID=66656 RepID=A0A6P5Z8T9_DURZI|nr:GPI-anchored protein LLG2-like [Durio zibethinus]XP_022748940.1 GPI-anchored protein LLG2-like [Durio zibethinus]